MKKRIEIKHLGLLGLRKRVMLNAMIYRIMPNDMIYHIEEQNENKAGTLFPRQCEVK